MSWLGNHAGPDLPEKDRPLAAIFSVAGEKLHDREKKLFREANPLGFILFKRNIESPPQIKSLTNELRDCVGRNCPVLVDQEGGRVARLQPPVWQKYPAADYFGDLFGIHKDFAKKEILETYGEIAADLVQAGLDVNCAPVLDLKFPETHDAIGDRSYSGDPKIVTFCADFVCRAFLKKGITPVIKHIPGHGRATVDSHTDLPEIHVSKEDLCQSDFLPFRTIASRPYGKFVWGMTAHILYHALDKENPASVSPMIHRDIIRGELGFQGFLLSDDIEMKGLAAYGDVDKRCLDTLMAGTDAVLYCSGQFKMMEKLSAALPTLSDDSIKRLCPQIGEHTKTNRNDA